MSINYSLSTQQIEDDEELSKEDDGDDVKDDVDYGEIDDLDDGKMDEANVLRTMTCDSNGWVFVDGVTECDVKDMDISTKSFDRIEVVTPTIPEISTYVEAAWDEGKYIGWYNTTEADIDSWTTTVKISASTGP